MPFCGVGFVVVGGLCQLWLNQAVWGFLWFLGCGTGLILLVLVVEVTYCVFGSFFGMLVLTVLERE